MKNLYKSFTLKLKSPALFSIKRSLNNSPESIVSTNRKKSNPELFCKSLKATIAAALLWVVTALSASAQTLGTYTFNGAAACPSVNTGVTAQPANAVFGTVSTVGAQCVASTTTYAGFKAWNSNSTIDLTEYNSFTLTPNTGYVLTLSSLVIDHFMDKTDANWALRSSLDNYGADIPLTNNTITAASQSITTTLPAATFTNIAGPITFHIYIYNASGSSKTTWSIDNLTLNGSINPVTPSNPTSNSPQCNPPGVALTRTGSPAAGTTWYWQTTATGTSTANSAATYNAATSGTYYIRAQSNATLLWSAGAGSLAVTVTPSVGATTFTAGASSVRCQGAGAISYAATAANTTGISYVLDAASLSGGNSINGGNGTVTYSATWSGTSTITATAAGCNPTNATHTATTNAPVATPVFVSGASSTLCQGAGTVTYTANATNSTGITYTLDATSLSGGNTIVAATGAVTYAPAWSGTTTITATAAGCSGPKTSTHTVTVTPSVSTPVFVSGASSSRCQAAGAVTYTANATNTTGITYTLDAASVTGGNTINSATGVVTYAATWSGTSTITASAAGCNGPKTATHTVTTTVTVTTPAFTLGSASTRCQAAGPATYTATASNTTGITYSLDAASVAASNSINAANGTVTYTATWTGTSMITASAAGCSGPQTSTHTVTTTPIAGTPVFASGTTSTRCQGAATTTYGSSATNATSITYSLNAASVSAGNSINSATGSVTYTAAYSGTTIITASAAGCSGPKTSTHTVTVTATVGTPVFTAGPSSTRCQTGGTVTYTATATTNTGITYSLNAAGLAGGNTINSATGAVTYSAAWAGTLTITATAAGCNGPSSSVHTVTTTPVVGPPAFASGSASVRCQGAGTVSYTASAANSTGITYSLDAPSIGGGNTINSSTGDVSYAASWSGTTTITANAAGCSPRSVTHTVAVTPTVGVPVFAMGASSSRCFANETINYSATATTNTGISYSLDAASLGAGITINSSNGNVTYPDTWIGTSIITATATGCNGPKTASHTVTTNGSVTVPVFAAGASSVICQASGTATYTATASYTSGITYSLDAASTAGGNSINPSTGAVSYAAAWAGTSVITAIAAGCYGPQGATHTVTVTPTAGTPVFSLGATSTRCQGAGNVLYDASATTTTGITYSLDAASTTGGNSINASTGEVTYIATWSGTTIITASAAGCNGPVTAIHTVTVTATVGVPVFVSGATSTRCQTAETVTYNATASDNTGITYDLDAASISGGNTIDQATGIVTYVSSWTGTSTVTATATGCNGPSTSFHTVTTTPVVGALVFSLGSASVRCQGASTVSYTASADNTTGITYSLDAASIAGGNTINTSNGDVTYAPSWSGTTAITANAAGCSPLSITHTVTVTSSVGVPVFAMGASSSRCFANETINYSATATTNTGIAYSLDPASLAAGNTIDAVTGDVTYLETWIGTSIITATATGCNGPKTATHTVTTNGAVTVPAFNSGASSVICQASGTVTYTATASYTSGITYSLDAASTAGGNSIDPSTGAVSYAAAWAGTSVITATAAGCYGPQSATHTVTVTPTVGTPVFSLGAASTRCQGAGNVLYDASATTTTGITYSLDAASTAGGNSINAATGEVTYSATWSGTTVITASAAGCNGPFTTTHTITVTPTVGVPVFVIGATSTRCQTAETVTYNATASDNTGITYNLDAASISGGNTIDQVTGIVTYVSSWTGTSTITATATGCNGPSTSVHTITTTPTVGVPVFTSGSASVRCQGVGTVPYTASATNTTTITYSLDFSSRSSGNTINSSTGSVNYTAGWSGTSIITASAAGCNGPRTSTHTVTVTATVGVPIFAIGASSSRCIGFGVVRYSATASNSTDIAYSLDGASTAAGNTINSATGDVSFAAGWTGTSVITASATGCNGPSASTHTVTTNSAVTAPVFSAGSSSVRCQGSATVSYSATANNYTSLIYSLDATSVTAGNTINAATGSVTYVAGWSGTSTITASAAGCYGPLTSLHTVTVTATVGVPVFISGATSLKCQGAETINYTANATDNTGITYTLNLTSRNAGNTINTSTGDVTYVAGYVGTTIVTATAAGCNGPKTATHTVTVNPTVTTPVFSGGAASTRCQGAGIVTYTASATNTTGIVYSLDAASLAASNSINSGTGAVTYNVNWAGTTIVTANAFGCNGPKTATHTVTITPTVGSPVFTFGASSARCQGAGVIRYSATATNSTKITYKLDNTTYNFGSNDYDPNTGDVLFDAAWSGTSTITATATGCNGPVIAVHTVTTTPAVGKPVFDLGASSTRCTGAGTVNYTANATNATGITYSLDAGSRGAGNTINAATGDVTFVAGWLANSTITATAAGCNGPKSATHTISSTPSVTIPVFASGSSSTRCQGAATVTYSASASNTSGITYSLDAASTAAGNFIKANGQLTYVAGWSGTTIVTASAAGCNGPATATHTVTTTPFVATPVFSGGAASTRCQAAGTVTYSATAANSTGITYSLDAASNGGGNSINAATGAVTYSAAWSGTSTITASATGCSGPATASHTVTITPIVGIPVFALGSSSIRCQGAGTAPYTATAANSTGITYTLDAASITAGNSINSANGTVAFTAAWTGATTITATAAGCSGPKTSSHTVTITTSVATPVFSAGASSFRCQVAGNVTYTATASNSTGITYSLDAASLAAGNSIASATGIVTYTAEWSGTTTITASAAGCNGPKTAQHTVTITPDGTPNFISGATSTRCQGAGNVTYTASNSNNGGVTYSLDAASIGGGNSINSATGVVTYNASWTGTTQITSSATGCNGVKTAVHTVTITPNGTPVFAMGDVSSRLQGAGVVRYSATSTNGAAVTYSLDAASITGGNSINSSTGDVTYVATWGSTTIITARVSGCNGLVSATHTVTLNSSVVNKQLYLSDPAQALDRNDPVATNDLTTTSSAPLGTSGTLGTISIDNNASGSVTGTSLTISNFVTGAGSNRLMLVSVALDANVTGIIYGAQSLTRAAFVGAGRPRVEMWQLLNPTSGTANVVITTNVSGSIKAGVTTFAGIDPTTPFRLPITVISGNSTPSATITSAANELVYDVIGISNDPTATASAGQTQRWDIKGILNMTGAASTKAGAVSVVMSWATSTNPNPWSQIALSLRPAPTTVTNITFTQSPALCLPLTIKAAKNIVVTNYVSVVSGVMPATPNLTAVLRYGVTNIITLKNPTYNSGTGLLTWTGSLPTDVTVPDGQAISLDVSTAQAGVDFTIDYDSKIKPSKIDLPVSTYIDISSLEVYTAPYAGGRAVISAVSGAVDYVRATVTDPFGFSDINGVDVTFIPVGGTKTATLVASAGCTRTYETVWNTTGASGNYTISATAKEGFENRVTSVKSTNFYFCTTCPPVAMPDSAVGAGGTPLLIDVLANDYDPNNNIKASSLAITSQPRNGSALLSGGKIVYIPNGNFAGRDTLTYQICDLTSPTPLCSTGQVYADIDPTIVDPCADAAKSHIYYIPFPEADARTALLASQNVTNVLNTIRTIISLKIAYPNMTIVWDQWEDGYEANILNPQQSTTLVWGDGNPYNGIAPGYPNDIIPTGGSIVLDNTMPVNPRAKSNLFYDGRDKIYSSGQITMTQALGDPSFFAASQTFFSVQAMKTNITSTADFGKSFTIPAGENFNSRDFRYSALFIRASTNNTIVNIDKDNNLAFDLTDTLQEGESILVNGGVMNGATITASAPIGVDLHFAGVDGGANGWSSRDVPIFPATWYSNVYYTPVPTVRSPDSSVVMLYNSLNRPITINWYSGAPASGVITLPPTSVVRFPLALSATATYKFVNLTGEAFTAIEIVDSYTPGSTSGVNGTYYDWSFNMISEQRLTTYATIAWAPGSTDGSGNYNPIWVTPANNTRIYVKYNGDVLNGGSISPCGLHYDVSYLLSALNYKKIFDASDRDQSGIAIYTCDGTKIAAVYGEDPSSTTPISTPGWDIGSTIQPFCALKLILANDDYAYTMTNRPVTINVLKNDGGFQSQIDPASVITDGFLQPKHGTVSVNNDGTLLYTPDAGYTGLDTLEYNVCSTPSPVVCDVALVIITISACPTPTGQNIISGQVFIDKNKDGINNDGGGGFPYAKVYLYTDGNCSGTISANELKDSVMVDSSGSYQFLTYPEKTVEDDFDGPGGTNTCASGSDGTGAWLTNWTDAGDPSIGYCVSPAQSYSNTDVEIVKDGAFSYALRLKDHDVSATRSVNLSGATAAYLSFSYRRATNSLSAGKDVLVQASANGIGWTTIFTISGNGVSDAAYVNVYNQNLLAYASATTYIRFVTNAAMKDPDEVFIDNISITYLKYPICYITKVDPAAIIPYYHFTTASQNALTANSGGTCLFPFDYGIVKNSITISGNLFNDANGLTDNLVNGTAIGSPSGAVIYAYLVDSVGKVAFKTTVNSATGAYSFPLADVLVNYTVVLSTSDSALYDAGPPSANLPAGWVSAGDAYGTVNGAGSGNKAGIATSSIAVKTALANITGVNFGIELLPFAGSGSNTAIDKGGTNSVIVPANTFTNTVSGSDAAPGTITSIRITIFPAKATTMTINGVSYTYANFPLAGVVIPANATGQPTQTITIDPIDGYVKVAIPFYTIDNAGKESKATGTALMRFLLDTDNDGVADIYDIDDENDGITDYVELCGNGATTFSCLPNGSDPSEDDDDDGIVNYKDADFGPLNAAGCLASIDSDSDGIPNYLDMDSDNDGIPDVVEAYGTDANGDGIIDNFTDTDGDGLSQNVDANNTGAIGSGQGLGFKDYDGDGIPNTRDLDSDNDGIPDIIEAGGSDPNNDGRVTSFTDANGNGLNDANELAGALLKTGADTNNDGRPESYPNKNADQLGYPNPYDLDSDGDGITDVVEAGFPNTIVYLNGVVTGVYTSGWANTVQALPGLTLVNTDGRGPANYLDIDSDDDGISDNIEGQATATYKVPADTDIDNDGLADAYDNNTAAYGGAGITLNDQDSDGIPDMLDTDTDNDGKADLNEASKIPSLTQATINSADADGDGLLDEFDILNVNLIATGSKYQNVSDAKMGANGSFAGPVTSGSNVTLVKTYFSDPDRDWRTYNILTLGDLVWYDFNNNGLYDGGETKLSGATVNLYADANGDNVPDGAAIASTVTDAAGSFTFTELTKTKYIAGVVLPAGYTLGTAIASSANPNNGTDNDNNGVTLAGSEVRTNNINLTGSSATLDIGLKGTGSIGDFVFSDTNGNGIQDAGETGIAGVKVTLTYPNGYVANTITNASGLYSFPGLADGTYPLTFTTPAGYLASTPLQGSDVTKDSDPVGGSVSVTITTAQVRTDIDAGFYLPYTLGNAVWYDFNNNGLKDVNEPVIPGATVKLYKDVNGDNTPDGAAITTVITDFSANYSFAGLQSGNYIIGLTLPPGYAMGTGIASSSNPNNNTDDDNNGVNLISGEVRTNFITLSGSNNTLDIGLKGTGSIGDFVFNDVNGNGLQDAAETGLAGVTVKLTAQNGATYTVTSNASGSYSFKGLIAGTYTISFTTPAGYIASDPLQGSSRLLDSDPVNGTASVTIVTGEFNADIDAGFYLPYALGDLVFVDLNNNGVKDAGETGASGVTVHLYADDNGDNIADGAAQATATTDATGNYQFTGLSSGNYIVGVQIPGTYTAGTTTAGSASPGNNIDNDNNGVNLTGGEERSNYIYLGSTNNTLDFGFKGSGTIGDFVWLDTNGDGIQQAGESGIAGVTVTLTASGGVTTTAITDAAGAYSFTSLIPGTYTVHFATPNVPNAPSAIPYIARKANQGGNTATDSDPNPATGDVTVVIATGEVNVKIDAGFAEDQDDDNDGIANTIENNGYKPFKDCDGDGIPNYLDASPGCPIPAGTDLFGNPYKALVWKDLNNDGISDFFDLDLDGILNELDLDSDNDGIPDIKEAHDARAVDANNDGMVDGIDNDGDGVLSSADQNDNAYGDEALIVTDADRDGKPGFLDLDTDGDGIVDAVEAGYPVSVTVVKGVVTGPAVNGWATSAKALGNFAYRNSDGRGNPNYSDIDSDDDGITDNIEGQSTGSYIVAADADADGDGLSDVYDLNINLFGGSGITPYDHDADGTPDYYDLDTDNDGAPDINEASRDFTLRPTNINVADADGDGLVDQYDILNISGLNSNVFRNVTNSNMGAQGSYNGPLPSGSNTKIVGIPTGVDRDWRASYILPLSITSLTGTLQNNTSQLTWTVHNEQDIDHYVVERSKNALSFDDVASVKSLNRPEQSYNYMDDVTGYETPIVYYRIRQVNRDGSIFYSKIISLKNETREALAIKVYPNPFSSIVMIQIFSLAKQTATAIIYDETGKEVMQKPLLLNAGNNECKITEAGRLLQGMYMLRVITKEHSYTEKLIKE